MLIIGCLSNPQKPPSIKIGRAKKEVANHYPFIERVYFLVSESGELIEVEAGGVQTEPAQIRPAERIRSDDGIQFTLSFDENERVHSISTNDKSFRLPSGIGIGSTFAEVKEIYKTYETTPIFRYGRMIEIDDGVLLGFSWRFEDGETDIGDDEEVEWIKLERIP